MTYPHTYCIVLRAWPHTSGPLARTTYCGQALMVEERAFKKVEDARNAAPGYTPCPECLAAAGGVD